ncbi:MAG: hypothetical protein RXP98_02655 [Thermoplasmata archaeon]
MIVKNIPPAMDENVPKKVKVEYINVLSLLAFSVTKAFIKGAMSPFPAPPLMPLKEMPNMELRKRKTGFCYY